VRNASALLVQKSIDLEPVRGNSSRKRHLFGQKSPLDQQYPNVEDQNVNSNQYGDCEICDYDNYCCVKNYLLLTTQVYDH
jgi:hypothetical protein